jgi:branched-chain amino acid aminotransferase
MSVLPQPFDTRDGVIWMNGSLIPWQQAQTHVLTHGLHYGSSVFEGERAYGGRIFKDREHSERFHRSAQLLGFTIPYSVEELLAAKAEVLSANKIVDGYVRPVAFRGSEMMAISAQHTKIHVAIAAWSWPNMYKKDVKAEGVRLAHATYRRPSPESAPCASKAAGLYMICTLSKHEAENAGFDDALMLDYRGYVAEATGANVFFVMDGKIHTPTPDCFLNGITRLTVIDLARSLGIEVIERHISPEEITKASEAFLTGTAAEITPVSEIAGTQYGVGKVTKQLMQAYSDLVRSPSVKAA